MRKFKSDRCWEHEDGEFVLDIDAEAAIEQARRDEREKCVTELRELHERTMPHGKSFIHVAAQHLAKGLNQ